MRLSFFFLFFCLDKGPAHLYSGEYNFLSLPCCRGKRRTYERKETVYYA